MAKEQDETAVDEKSAVESKTMAIEEDGDLAQAEAEGPETALASDELSLTIPSLGNIDATQIGDAAAALGITTGHDPESDQAASGAGHEVEAPPPVEQQVATAQPEAPTTAQSPATASSPASTPPPAATPDGIRAQQIAAGLAVTPAMVAAFKAANPIFSQQDDATAAETLKELLAWDVIAAERAAAAPPPDAETAAAEAASKSLAPTSSLAQQRAAAFAYSPGAFIADKLTAAGTGILKSGFETYDAVNEIALGGALGSERSEWRQGLENYYANTSGISGAAAVIAQWGAAFVGIGKFAKLAGIASKGQQALAAAGVTGRSAQVVGAVAQGGAADFLAFDGLEGRLSDVVQQYPTLANPATAFLATKPDDTQAEGRLKNALEGFALGATVDVVLAGFRALRAHRAGDAAGVEKAIDDGAETFGSLNKPSDELNSGAGNSAEPGAGDGAQPAVPDASAHAAFAGTERSASTPSDSLRSSMGAKVEIDPATAEGRAADAVLDPTSDHTAALRRAEIDDEIAAASREMAQRIIDDPAAPIISPTPGQPVRSTFESLTSSAELRAVINATEKEILRGIEGTNAARPPVTHAETLRMAQELADETSQDVGHLLVRLQQDAKSTEQLSARLLAYRATKVELTKNLLDMAHAVKRGEPGTYGTLDDLRDAFEHNLATYAHVNDLLLGAQAEVGRSLAIMRHSERLGSNLRLGDLTRLGAGPSGAATTMEELADAVIMAGNNQKLLGQIANPSKYAQVRDALVSLYIKNILSGPTTHLVNIMGNVTAALIHPASKILGGVSHSDPRIIREGLKQYGFMLSESAHALNMAIEAYKRNANILDPGSMGKAGLAGAEQEALTASKISGGYVPDDSMTGWLANGLFKGIDAISTRALGASDEFFKQTLYASELSARAWADGVAQGLTGDQLKAFIKQQRDAGFLNDPAIGSATANPQGLAGLPANAHVADALEVARFNTFTSEIKSGTFVGDAARSILFVTNRHPSLKLAVPFVKVVHNLLHYTGSMTPLLAQRMELYKEAIARGGREAAVAKGRLALGYGLWTAAIGLAASGQITGDGPTKADGSPDHAKRQLLEQSGWKANSLKLGNTYINLARLDPIGLPLSIAAKIADRIHTGLTDDKGIADIATAMSFALGHVMLDRTWMQGVADLMDALNDDTGRMATRYAGNIAGSLLVPNAVRQLATQNIDPNIREARDFVELILRRTPFASEGLAARRLPWGEKMHFNPQLYSQATTADPVMTEFARLLETGEPGAGQPLPRMKPVPGDKSIDLATFRLANGELLYDAYGDLIQQPDPEVPPLKETLAELIASDAYQHEMIDGPSSFRGTRLKAFTTIVQRYKAAAWRRILEDYPEVRERVFGKRTRFAEDMEAREASGAAALIAEGEF